MHVGLDFLREGVAAVVAASAPVAAPLAAEVALVVDGEHPGVRADEGHEDGEDVGELHCEWTMRV